MTTEEPEKKKTSSSFCIVKRRKRQTNEEEDHDAKISLQDVNRKGLLSWWKSPLRRIVGSKTLRNYSENLPEAVHRDAFIQTTCCVLCRKEFRLFKVHRHHCRKCGKSFCGNCCSNKIYFNKISKRREVKRKEYEICDPCFNDEKIIYRPRVVLRAERVVVWDGYYDTTTTLTNGSSNKYRDSQTRKEEEVAVAVAAAREKDPALLLTVGDGGEEMAKEEGWEAKDPALLLTVGDGGKDLAKLLAAGKAEAEKGKRGGGGESPRGVRTKSVFFDGCAGNDKDVDKQYALTITTSRRRYFTSPNELAKGTSSSFAAFTGPTRGIRDDGAKVANAGRVVNGSATTSASSGTVGATPSVLIQDISEISHDQDPLVSNELIIHTTGKRASCTLKFRHREEAVLWWAVLLRLAEERREGEDPAIVLESRGKRGRASPARKEKPQKSNETPKKERRSSFTGKYTRIFNELLRNATGVGGGDAVDARYEGGGGDDDADDNHSDVEDDNKNARKSDTLSEDDDSRFIYNEEEEDVPVGVSGAGDKKGTSPTKECHVRNENPKKRRPMYARPDFLGLVPRFAGKPRDGGPTAREILSLPTGMRRYETVFGYAECRNAGKSDRNEDMTLFTEGFIFEKAPASIPYRLWAVFDGHGGWNVAMVAVRIYKIILLQSIRKHCCRGNVGSDVGGVVGNSSLDRGAAPEERFDVGMIPTALKSSFGELDEELKRIFDNKSKPKLDGGASSLAVLEINGAFWIASAGDCGALAFVTHPPSSSSSSSSSKVSEGSGKKAFSDSIPSKEGGSIQDLTEPFTICRERQRLQAIACNDPNTLKNAFCRLLFEPPKGRRKWKGNWIPQQKDYEGKDEVWVERWDHHSKDVLDKIKIEKEHVDATDDKYDDMIRTKMPMITGEKPFMRLLGITRCARGVGDFNLCACASSRKVWVRPFMSNVPEICILRTQPRRKSPRFEFQDLDEVRKKCNDMMDLSEENLVQNDDRLKSRTKKDGRPSSSWSFEVGDPEDCTALGVDREANPGREDIISCNNSKHGIRSDERRVPQMSLDLKKRESSTSSAPGDSSRATKRSSKEENNTAVLRSFSTVGDVHEEGSNGYGHRGSCDQHCGPSTPTEPRNGKGAKVPIRDVFVLVRSSSSSSVGSKDDATERISSRDKDDEAVEAYMIVASDGIFDVMTSEDAAKHARVALLEYDNGNTKKKCGRLNYAAQKLVEIARGVPTERNNGDGSKHVVWPYPPQGSHDDICVFLIQLQGPLRSDQSVRDAETERMHLIAERVRSQA